jgi:2-dehydro-3-deoxyphosphogluconate aldolase/(4S)-4-hydroxy-2-oxoglutarate aldolase
MTGFDELFGDHRVMIILRGLPPDETVEVAHRAWDAGIELLEVPIGTPEMVPALSAAVKAGAERGKLVGAGTVVTLEQARVAAEMGARYTVAPGLDLTVLGASLAAGLPHLPGVATATEVHQARRAGCTWVKAFPAAALGPAWFSAIRGPFPDLHYVATGGITAETAGQFLAAGAQVVAVGGALSDPAQLTALSALK